MAESVYGGEEFKGVIRAMTVVIVKEKGKAFCALTGVEIGVSNGPLAERYLDEALGFAIGLISMRRGESMIETEEGDGVAHGVRAVAGAVGGVN